MKTAIISGASKGIGKATAISLAKEGYAVIVGYCRSKESAQSVCNDILADDGIAEAYKFDVSNAQEIKSAVNYVKEKYNTVDLVVANAGIGLYGMLIDYSDEDIQNVITTDLVGCITLCREASKVMLDQKYGNIVTVASIWGEIGGSCESVYSAAKGGVIAFTKALAKELAPNGIRVNCVSPGFIDTDINARLSKDEVKAVTEGIPMGKVGSTSDVANAVVWLASEKAEYVTGTVVAINGGGI